MGESRSLGVVFSFAGFGLVGGAVGRGAFGAFGFSEGLSDWALAFGFSAGFSD